MGLLNASDVELGFNLGAVDMQGTEISVTRFLGRGGSSTVYETRWKGEPVVAKIFHATSLGRCQHELEILQEMQNVKLCKDTYVPKCVANSTQTLLLTPIGKPFALLASEYANPNFVKCNARHFALLLSLLECVHATHTHRDLSLRNFFEVDQGVLLNDWGCGARINSRTIFEGCVQFASERVLEFLAQNRYVKFISEPADDLEMVVHVFYSRLNPCCCEIQAEQDPKKLKQFWAAAMNPTFWWQMVSYARDLKYDNLKKKIACILE